MSSTSAALLSSIRPRLSARIWGGARKHPALVVAAAAFALAWASLLVTYERPHIAVPKATALSHALADPGTRSMLARVHWSRLDVTAIDSHYEMLGFYRGPRLVATVDERFDGRVLVLDHTNLTRTRYVYGSDIANEVRVLLGLCVVFVLMSAVWPLRRIRNLDVAVAASFAVSIALFNHWMLDRMVYLSYAAMAYLAIRCAWRALGPQRRQRAATPIYDHLTRGWSATQQVRLLRLLAVSCALVVAMVGLSSLSVIDVGYAVMEGATAIVHGLLPYGHVGDILHGDTYPIASYLLYAPFAWFSPVHTVFDDADPALWVAVCATLLAAWGIARLAVSRPRRPVAGERRAAELVGLRTAIAWLTFPPLLVTVSTGTTDVVLAALLVGALLLWRRPGAGTAVLAFAAWFKLVPAALFPLWIASLRRAGIGRALLSAVAVSGAMLAALVALGGADGLVRMVTAMSFQLTRTAPNTLWTFAGSVPLQQLTEALTLSLIAGATVRIWRERSLADDRVRFAALCAAVLLGVQLGGNYWTFMYLTWVFPFIALSLLASPPTTDPSR